MASSKLFDFVEKIRTYDNIGGILAEYDDKSMKGFVYERLWDLMIKFGFCSYFPNSKYSHYIGNTNTANLKKMKSIQKYIKSNNIVSGNSGGYSDITLLNEKTNEYIFISCKYFNSVKSVDSYDIQKIITMCEGNSDIYEKYKIFILVSDKKAVIDKINGAKYSSYVITKHMNNILDINDLNKAFKLFKTDIAKYKFDEYDAIYCCHKDKLNLRFHQSLIASKTIKRMEEGHKQILWGSKCRSGKTYMVGGLISIEKDMRKTINVLVITPAPNETIPQFTDELFNKFIDFKDFEIHTITTGNDLKDIELKDNNIIVVSKQLIQNYINENRIDKIAKLKLDLIVFDENHFAGTTNLSKQIMESYAYKNTVKLYLTATYNKPLHEWNIPFECQIYWDIEDEKLCKAQNITKLIERHGNIVNDIVKNYHEKGYSNDEIFEVYNNYPELHLITNMWDRQRYENIKEKIMDTKYGFSFDVLFSLNKNKQFNYPTEVKKVLRYISGTNREKYFKDGDKSILSRITRICQETKSRRPFTQLWFLPIIDINFISIELQKLIGEDRTLKNYDVLIVNSKNEELRSDIKLEIRKCERLALKHNKDGLIILAGNMLSLGITLEKCDVVFLMNNTLSADKVMQQMYRCMTETTDGSKKYGYVVDLNISRVLNTCITYNIRDTTLTVEDKIKYIVTNIINFDGDYFINKDIDVQKVVDKLTTIWKDDPLNHYLILLKNLDDSYVTFNNDTQKLINQKFVQLARDKSILNAKVLIGDELDEKQELPKGKETIVDKISEKEEKKIKEFIVSFQKDVLHYVIPLTCILTMDNDKKNFMEMITMIQQNKELIEIFDEQSQIWWKRSGLIDVIKKIVNEYYDEDSIVYNISIQFKMQIKSLIDSPKQLLELIDACLKPKEIEKQKFGEVFTPIKLVNEMLDKLPKEVWENEKFKWFDPATGMGNFPIVVYLRLMEGLQKKIPNELKRKRHILENMLYMSELNKKNCYVVQQIFNMNKKYKLNLHCGDTLKMDIKKKFNVEKFDIIIGNPPYNSGGIRSYTGTKLGEKSETIWTKFVEYSVGKLNKNGYLVFITPLSWLKRSHKYHKLLLEKHIIWMKLWDDSRAKVEINADIPLSIYVIKNMTNNMNKTTEIESDLKRSKITSITNVYLNPKYSISLAYQSVFGKLIKLIESNSNYKLDIRTKTCKSEGEQIPLPEKYNSNDSYGIDTYRIKDGYFVKKLKEHFDDLKKTKLIIANKAGLNGSLIDDGKLGLTGNHKYYILGDNLEKLQQLFNSNIGRIVAQLTRYGQHFLDKDAFEYLPDVRNIPHEQLPEITDSNLYKLLKLTEEEIKSIEIK